MQKRNLFHYFDKKDDGESSSRPNAPCDVHTSNSRSPSKTKDPKLQMMILKLYLTSILLIMNVIPESVFQYDNIQLTKKKLIN